MDIRFDRRALIGAAGLTIAAGAVRSAPGRRRALRLAHLTDVHVEPGPGEGGMAQALAHVQAQADQPELILNGGDAIMDCFGRDEAATAKQWSLWTGILAGDNAIPVESAIGNHDVWGGNKQRSGTTGREPRWGKRWAMEVHGLERPYRSFDRAGWHFVVLDSTFVADDGYIAQLDDEQYEWLAADLAAVDPATPILVLSHQPILSACAYFDGDNENREARQWQVPGAWMHIDARRIKDLFGRHPNVKLALSGHIHLADRVDYNGVTYLCNGAVSGNWWNTREPAYQEFAPAYAIVDLYTDGTFEHQLVPYGWKPA